MDFFNQHGILFLLGLTFFPRITTLFFTLTPFGFLGWVGWIFAPHFLVAIYSLKYFNTNPVLVICAWVFAFTGTILEKKLTEK